MKKELANSMISSKVIITVASWERRFIIGITDLIKQTKCKQVLAFYFKEYIKWTETNLDSLKEFCKLNNVSIDCIELDFTSPEHNWIELSQNVRNRLNQNIPVTLDITTMPREIIWQLLFLIDNNKRIIQYTYHLPKSYAKDWLSRDPEKPRLVLKLSGISHLNKETALVIVTGYDVARSKQLIRFFEPMRLDLGLQVGNQYKNRKQNVIKHSSSIDRHPDLHRFNINAYSIDDALKILNTNVGPLIPNYNVIMSSLGPKPSAISIYLFWKKNRSVSLVYTPSKEFNKNYSQGYRSRIHGIINPK